MLQHLLVTFSLFVAIVARPLPDQRMSHGMASPGNELAESKIDVSHNGKNIADLLRDSRMTMTFFGGFDFSLWLGSFEITGSAQLLAACVGIAALAALYEAIKIARVKAAVSNASDPHNDKHHWFQTFAHFIQVTVGNLLMLAVMTYSSWLFVAVSVGATLGYGLLARCVSVHALLGQAVPQCH